MVRGRSYLLGWMVHWRWRGGREGAVSDFPPLGREEGEKKGWVEEGDSARLQKKPRIRRVVPCQRDKVGSIIRTPVGCSLPICVGLAEGDHHYNFSPGTI